MAFTADEEARLRSLLGVVRKLPAPEARSPTITDKVLRDAINYLERYLADIVQRMQV